MKKGRHRRFEEARALKRTNEVQLEPCPECGAEPDDEHASWCMATADLEDEDEEQDELGYRSGSGR
jgi:hypothetical protein